MTRLHRALLPAAVLVLGLTGGAAVAATGSPSTTGSPTSTSSSLTTSRTTSTTTVMCDRVLLYPPEDLRVASGTPTTVSLAWRSVTPATFDVYRDGVLVGTTFSTAFTDTGLEPGSAHAYQVIARSDVCNYPQTATSATLRVTTGTAVTTTTTTSCIPGNGSVEEIGPTWIRFRIDGSVCVAQAVFWVDVYQQAPDGTWTRVSTGYAVRGSVEGATVLAEGLSPATTYWYAFRDPRGVSAPRTGPVTTLPSPGTTTTTTTAAGCSATYHLREQWDGGFRAEVQVTAGAAGTDRWTVSWPLAAGQAVTQSWNAGVTVADGTVTARNVSWNGRLAPSGSAVLGFIGRWAGANPVPSVSCSAE